MSKYQDEELNRIATIIKAIDELDNRFYRAKERLGQDGYDRIITYIKSRRKWFFDRFASTDF